MASVRVDVNIAGVRELLSGPEVTDWLGKTASRMSGEANAVAAFNGLNGGRWYTPAYWSFVDRHSKTSIGHVWTGGLNGRIDNAAHNTLLRVMHK